MADPRNFEEAVDMGFDPLRDGTAGEYFGKTVEGEEIHITNPEEIPAAREKIIAAAARKLLEAAANQMSESARKRLPRRCLSCGKRLAPRLPPLLCQPCIAGIIRSIRLADFIRYVRRLAGRGSPRLLKELEYNYGLTARGRRSGTGRRLPPSKTIDRATPMSRVVVGGRGPDADTETLGEAVDRILYGRVQPAAGLNPDDLQSGKSVTAAADELPKEALPKKPPHTVAQVRRAIAERLGWLSSAAREAAFLRLLGHTQQQIAAKLGKSQGYISKVLRSAGAQLGLPL